MGKNILEVCLSPDLGGLELCVVDYFNDFSKKTDTKIIVAEGKKLSDFIDNENKFVIKRNKLIPLIPAIKVAKYIDDNSIDIIHFHWTKDIAVVVLAKVLSRRKPKLVQSRHMAITRFKDDFYHKWLYKNIDIIHAVTNQVKEQLEMYIPSDIRPVIKKVYLGVEEKKINFDKITKLKSKYNIKDEFIVGIIGRIEEGKGQYILLNAIALLKDLNIKVLIVGDSMEQSYMTKLLQNIEELGIQNRVIFTGFTKDVNEHIKLCDCTVLATKKETFGLVVIESMINKVPIIATNSGGPLEIIEDKKDGLLFDRTSSDLSYKIKYLYDSSEIKNKLAMNGYKKVKNIFDKERQMNKMYEILYES